MSLASSTRVGWCPGALRPMRAGDGLLVRIKPRGGRLSADTLAAVAALAARHGNGATTLTSRANLQLRGVTDGALPALTDALGALDLLDAGPEAEAVRNVVCNPFARSGTAVCVAAEGLEERLSTDPALWRLPAKFCWAVDGPEDLALGPIGSDVHVTIEPGGEGFVRLAGGKVGAWIAPGGLPAAAARLGDAFLSLCAEGDILPHRMRDLLSTCDAAAVLGRAGLIATAAADLPPGIDAVGPYRRAGMAGIAVAFPFGLAAAAALDRIADVARSLSGNSPSGDGGRQVPPETSQAVRLTPWRTLLLPGVTNAAGLAGTAAIVDPGDPRLGVAACVGAPACGRASTSVPADAAWLSGALTKGRGVRLHVSGCAKGCAHAGAAAVTLAGRAGAYDVVLGGRAGDPPTYRGLRPEALAAMLPTLLAETGA